MAMMPSTWTLQPIKVVGQYNVQRFKQFGCEDSANFYMVAAPNTKRGYALFPTFGRQHINYLGVNRLIFSAEPRAIFRSITYWYSVVGNAIYRIDRFYNQVEISGGQFLSTSGNVFFTYLVINNIVFACFVDRQNVYVYQENTGIFYQVTDPNAPGVSNVDGEKPGFIVAFGNRIAVSVFGSSKFVLSEINLLNTSGVFDPATCFTVGGQSVFAYEAGIIGQMAVLNNTLYIFTDFTTGIWSNIAAVFSGTNTTFPWKKNSTSDWNFGIADPLSLDVGFGRLAFLAQNISGLLQPMSSSGGQPERISSKAIDVLLQRYANSTNPGGPFRAGNAVGFLYQYENDIFYRLSAGIYTDTGILDQTQEANSLEYGYEVKDWHRCIELNGERCRIQRHIFFNSKHLVTVENDNTVYEMSGRFYQNELRNNDQEDDQAADSYIQHPFRYERVTPIIAEEDNGEFETDYVEIDFCYGESFINYSDTPFRNALFVISESSDPSDPEYVVTDDSDPSDPTYLLAEQGNTPQIDELTYNALYKPHIELYFSDNGGVSFSPADVLEFSDQGKYQWRMRWYQLGCSRNRVYKLVAVSPVPIVILGGWMNARRVSGSTN